MAVFVSWTLAGRSFAQLRHLYKNLANYGEIPQKQLSTAEAVQALRSIYPWRADRRTRMRCSSIMIKLPAIFFSATSRNNRSRDSFRLFHRGGPYPETYYTGMRTNRKHPSIGEILIESNDDPAIGLCPCQYRRIGCAPRFQTPQKSA